MAASLHIGPLPSASYCREMEELCPGFTREVLELHKSASAHRQSLETKVVSSRIELSQAGARDARNIAYAGLLVCAIYGATGNAQAGAVLGSGLFAALAAVFAAGKLANRRELEAKARTRQAMNEGDADKTPPS